MMKAVESSRACGVRQVRNAARHFAQRVEIGARTSRFCANDDSTTRALDARRWQSPRAGGRTAGDLDPAMPPKKKGNGEDEAETCPADMDPEVWAVVKDVNQLVALASKKNQRPRDSVRRAAAPVERRGVEPEGTRRADRRARWPRRSRRPSRTSRSSTEAPAWG